MPRKARELSALVVGRLREDGRHAVGGVDGLHLVIRGASRAWVLRVVSKGRRCDIGLGPYPEVTLADARETAMEIRRDIRKGGDPVAERRARRAEKVALAQPKRTFQSCADAYVDAHRSGWKNEKHVAQWSATLKAHAYPVIGDRAISEVETGDVLKILTPLWSSKTETASRLRGRIESVLDWAKVQGLREGDNPARWRGHLDKLLPPRRRVQKVQHHAALPYARVAEFMGRLRRREGPSARALEFSILCAARSGEVRGARWAEIDFTTGVWIVPAERMKAGKEHRVPLSPQALRLLEAAPRFDGDDTVFPAPRGGALSDMALTAVIRRLGEAVTQHGFRSTFRDWAGETTSYPREVIEHALAHQLKDKAEAAYQRGDLLAKRRRLMQDWAAYCDGAQPSEPADTDAQTTTNLSAESVLSPS